MLSDALDALPPITLEEMDSVKLLNRTDTKYLTTLPVLERILLRAAACGYRALETEGTKHAPYDSIYFDTPDLRMFTDHRNRKLVRQKVRTRVYLNSGLTFLEIKRKNNHGRTKKKRMAIPAGEFHDFRTDAEACNYLSAKSFFKAEEIAPAMETAFSRITLVNAALTERLTIDLDLRFRNLRNGREVDLGDGVIIELKQDGRADSRMKRILLDLRVKPFRISKYCVATAMTDPRCRPGRFKLKLIKMQKIIHKPLLCTENSLLQ